MKKLSGGLLVILLFLSTYGQCTPRISYSSEGKPSQRDSNRKHELLITPVVGYGELPIIESPLSNVIFYNNEHNLTTSLNYGCSVDYLVSNSVSVGLEANYQTVPFNSLIIKELYFYQTVSYPYSYINSPVFGCSADFIQSNGSFGIDINYQTVKCSSSTTQQPFYPYSILFQSGEIGLRKLFYFEKGKRNNWYFYMGGRADFSVWNETDNWSLGYNSSYEPIFNEVHDFQLSLLFIGGIRYFVLHSLGIQLEGGFGFGSPYYLQSGIIFRLGGASGGSVKKSDD